MKNREVKEKDCRTREQYQEFIIHLCKGEVEHEKKINKSNVIEIYINKK